MERISKEWDRWTVCSATCGGGMKKRIRALKLREAWLLFFSQRSKQIVQADGGKECEGSAEEESGTAAVLA